MRQSPSIRRAVATSGSLAVALSAFLSGPLTANAQLRVVEWNITQWPANDTNGVSRISSFQTAVYGIVPSGLTLAGQSMSPDVFILQEIRQDSGSGQTNVTAFVNMLNTAPGSPGDWMAAPYVFNSGAGGAEGNALVYRSSKLTWLSTISLNAGTGSGPTNPPRDGQRWRVRLAGYSAASTELYIYGAHFKSAAGAANEARRLPEAERIRGDSNTLPAGAHFLLGADLNMQSSTEDAYQFLVGATPPTSGRFYDPINRPGDWENSSGFRNIHTQNPVSQMDSRHDQVLISDTLRDGLGLSYVPAQASGNIFAPFRSAGTLTGQDWFDPNHSYRAWGNDGESYDVGLRTGANTQVGPAIAQALINTCNVDTTGGHLPVFLDLQVPAKLGAPTGTIAFGTVIQGTTATQSIQITNAANIIFSRTGTGAGIERLNFSFAISSGFSVQGGNGPFSRTATAAPAQANTYTIAMDTSTTGTKAGTITITSNDPDVPSRVINLTGTVNPSVIVPPTGSFDVNADGTVNEEDLYSWFAGVGARDCNNDGSVNSTDSTLLRTYLRFYEATDMASGRR